LGGAPNSLRNESMPDSIAAPRTSAEGVASLIVPAGEISSIRSFDESRVSYPLLACRARKILGEHSEFVFSARRRAIDER